MSGRSGRAGRERSSELLARLRAGLAPIGTTAESVPPVPAGLTPRTGAVLVLIYPREGRPHVVLTRRSALLKDHSGEISLPGGGPEPGDESLVDTALRETQEELGVRPDTVEVWGQLRPIFVRASHFVITPFVAYRRRRPSFRPNPNEVAEVLEVPLETLLDRRLHGEEVWMLRGEPHRVGFFRVGQHRVWGATARILSQLVELVAPEARVGPGRLAPGEVV